MTGDNNPPMAKLASLEGVLAATLCGRVAPPRTELPMIELQFK